MKIRFPVLMMIALLDTACTVKKLNEFLREGEYLNAATIEKLASENLKEIARGLNRRTEFRVIQAGSATDSK